MSLSDFYIVVRYTVFATLTLAMPIEAATAGANSDPPPNCAGPIRIATGGQGTPYHLIGEALAVQLRALVPRCEVNVITTAGGVENLNMLREGRADVILANIGVAWQASIGIGKFAGAAVPLRALAVTFPNTMHLLAAKNSGVNTMADLRGKRLSTGSVGSGTEAIAFLMLQAAGIDRDRDLKRVSLSLDDSIRELRAGRLDALIFGGAVPVTSIAQFLAEGNSKLVPHGEVQLHLSPIEAALYRPGEIASGSYANQPMSVSAIDVWDLVLVSDRFPGSLAFALTKAMFDSRSKLIDAHTSMRFLDLANQNKINTVSFHLGAAEYFAMRGVAPFDKQFFGLKR